MRTSDLHFNLPSFDELKSSALKPPSSRKTVKSERAMNVIAPVAATGKLKVAAYCRVSTDSEDQKSSIDIQRQHFASLAAKNPDWDFIGIYWDVISGTKKEKRPELNRMLGDCATGKINLVLTKSVSRFARNTADLLEMVRSLTADGVDIFFEREKIDTRTMGSEFLLTVLASLAEDESHSISSNCRWGLQKRFQDGTYRPANAPYGYDLVDGGFVINEQEADVVRDIFRKRIDGWSLHQITDDLNSREIPSKRAGQIWKGKAVSGEWSGSVVSKLLKNEAYIGDLLLQKSYTNSDFKMCKNRGEHPQFYLEDHHPAIISKETYEKAKVTFEGKCSRTGNEKYAFTGMLFCGECGSLLHHSRNRCGNDFWTCSIHRNDISACRMMPVPQANIEDAFREAMEKIRTDHTILLDYKEKVWREYRAAHKAEIESLEHRRDEIDTEMMSLQRSRNSGATAAPEFLARKNVLRSEKMEIQSQLDRMADIRISQAEELHQLSHSCGGSFVFSEGAFSKAIESVTVHGKDHFTFHFKCGLSLEERSGTCR